jgi:hypothetical protein
MVEKKHQAKGTEKITFIPWSWRIAYSALGVGGKTGARYSSSILDRFEKLRESNAFSTDIVTC